MKLINRVKAPLEFGGQAILKQLQRASFPPRKIEAGKPKTSTVEFQSLRKILLGLGNFCQQAMCRQVKCGKKTKLIVLQQLLAASGLMETGSYTISHKSRDRALRFRMPEV